MSYLRLKRRYGRCIWLAVLATVGTWVICLLIQTLIVFLGDARTEPASLAGTHVTGCPRLRGMDDVLVVLKTGATEAPEKVPVHIKTMLRCVPKYVIFSDYEEDIAGVRTYDVLRSVSEKNKRYNPDFRIYNRLHTLGRKGLISDDWPDEANGPFGKPGNPGWKLDKWKFVPMIDEALAIEPEAQWYVFIEADSYIFWSNLVHWLGRFDSRKLFYLGAPMQIGGDPFAYGGAGIVLSKPAMHLISQYRAKRFKHVEEMTARTWAGDHVLGKILQTLRVPLVWSWPMLVPSSAWEFEYFTRDHGRDPWCYPAVSFHHMAPKDIEDIWLFEQHWLTSGEDSAILHMDVFKELVYDVTLSEKDDWDNFSSGSEDERNNGIFPTTAAECARKCALTIDCVQFSFGNETCWTSRTVKRGVRRSGVQSGWMTVRIKALLRNRRRCSQVQYVQE